MIGPNIFFVESVKWDLKIDAIYGSTCGSVGTELVLRQPEISGLNPVIGIYYLLSTVLLKFLKRRKKEKEAANDLI